MIAISDRICFHCSPTDRQAYIRNEAWISDMHHREIKVYLSHHVSSCHILALSRLASASSADGVNIICLFLSFLGTGLADLGSPFLVKNFCYLKSRFRVLWQKAYMFFL